MLRCAPRASCQSSKPISPLDDRHGYITLFRYHERSVTTERRRCAILLLVLQSMVVVHDAPTLSSKFYPVT